MIDWQISALTGIFSFRWFQSITSMSVPYFSPPLTEVIIIIILFCIFFVCYVANKRQNIEWHDIDMACYLILSSKFVIGFIIWIGKFDEFHQKLYIENAHEHWTEDTLCSARVLLFFFSCGVMPLLRVDRLSKWNILFCNKAFCLESSGPFIMRNLKIHATTNIFSHTVAHMVVTYGSIERMGVTDWVCACLLMHSHFHVHSFGINFLWNDFVLHVVLESHFVNPTRGTLSMWHQLGCRQKACIRCSFGIHGLGKREFSNIIRTALRPVLCCFALHCVALVCRIPLWAQFTIFDITFHIRNRLKGWNHGKLSQQIRNRAQTSVHLL